MVSRFRRTEHSRRSRGQATPFRVLQTGSCRILAAEETPIQTQNTVDSGAAATQETTRAIQPAEITAHSIRAAPTTVVETHILAEGTTAVEARIRAEATAVVIPAGAVVVRIQAVVAD